MIPAAMKGTRMTRAGERLLKAAAEAVAVANGKADPKSYRVHPPAEIDAKRIRTRLKLSQGQFAERYGLDLATLKGWEQGRRTPTGASATLLRVIDREPEAVARALGSADDRRTKTRRGAALA